MALPLLPLLPRKKAGPEICYTILECGEDDDDDDAVAAFGCQSSEKEILANTVTWQRRGGEGGGGQLWQTYQQTNIIMTMMRRDAMRDEDEDEDEADEDVATKLMAWQQSTSHLPPLSHTPLHPPLLLPLCATQKSIILASSSSSKRETTNYKACEGRKSKKGGRKVWGRERRNMCVRGR